MAITELHEQEMRELMAANRNAAALSLGAELLELVTPLKVEHELLQALGRLELAEYRHTVRESAAVAIALARAAELYGELNYAAYRALEVHAETREYSRLGEMPTRPGEF